MLKTKPYDMKKILLFTISIAFLNNAFSQVGIGTTLPNSSSLLEIKSTTQGILIPRMTQNQKSAILTPAEGLLIYQSDADTGFYYYSGAQWKLLSKYTLPPATTSTLGGIIVGNGLTVTSSGVLSTSDTIPKALNLILYYKFNLNTGIVELWKAKPDGTSQSQIAFTLPPNTRVATETAPQFTAERTKIIIGLNRLSGSAQVGRDIYSMNIDGTGLVRIIDGGGNNVYMMLGGVY